MGDYEGRIKLSPPAAYPDIPWGRYENKGNLKPRHHVYAIDYCSSLARLRLKTQVLRLARTPFTRTEDDPTS